MRKILCFAVTIAGAGILSLGSAQGQQTPPATTQKPPATSAPKKTTTPSSTQHAAAKPGTTTARKPTTLQLTTEKDKESYAIGMSVGRGLHRDNVDVDPAIIARGIKDAMSGGKTLLSDQEAQLALSTLQTGLRKKQEELRAAEAAKNKQEGQAFLDANKSKDGVVTLPSGLQYKVLQMGTGPKPAETDTVECNYRGTLLDGKEFDSSYKRGQTVTFPLNQVIKGWTEALQLMPVGSKWQLFIPSELAYDDHGQGPDIGPGATLIFEVELVSIKEKGKPAEPPTTTPEAPKPQ